MLKQFAKHFQQIAKSCQNISVYLISNSFINKVRILCKWFHAFAY